MNADDLIGAAKRLLPAGLAGGSQSEFRRSVSTAYYAVFHALAAECVTQTVGWKSGPVQDWTIVTPLYRTLDHARAKRLFAELIVDKQAAPELKQIARTFIELQSERIRADYDPQPGFTYDDASALVALALATIIQFRGLPENTRREIAIQLITRRR